MKKFEKSIFDFEKSIFDTGEISFSEEEIGFFLNQLSLDTSFKNEIIAIDPKTDLIFTSSDINENIINKRRGIKLEKEFTNKLLHYLKEDEFEYGFTNRADLLIKEQMNINNLATKEWLSKLYVSNFNNADILIGILRLISRQNVDEISPEGKTMAIGALSHKNSEVQECGIRVFESWGTLDSLKILENVEVKSKWLKDYLTQVIENIQSEHAHFSQKN